MVLVFCHLPLSRPFLTVQCKFYSQSRQKQICHSVNSRLFLMFHDDKPDTLQEIVLENELLS